MRRRRNGNPAQGKRVRERRPGIAAGNEVRPEGAQVKRGCDVTAALSGRPEGDVPTQGGAQRSLSDFVDAGRGHRSPKGFHMGSRGRSPRNAEDISHEPRMGEWHLLKQLGP